jgi:hypothetical protein
MLASGVRQLSVCRCSQHSISTAELPQTSLSEGGSHLMGARQTFATAAAAISIALLVATDLNSPRLLGETSRSVTYQAQTLTPLNMPPTFSNGYLAVFSEGGIDVYGPDGGGVRRVPSSRGRYIRNVAFDTDGSMAAAIADKHRDGHIGLSDSIGNAFPDIQTEDFNPTAVAFGPDHSIWAVGQPWPRTVETSSDFFILRHYSRKGQLLGAFLPRSSFPAVEKRMQEPVAYPSIQIANNRIGVAIQLAHWRDSAWVETDLSGKEIGRWPWTQNVMPITITSTGRVFAQGNGIYELDRAVGTWKPAQVAQMGVLVGADENQLVFADRSSASLIRVAIPSNL